MYRPIDLCLSLLVFFIFKQLVHLSKTKKQKLFWIICHEKINDKLALSDRAVIILETPLKKICVHAPFEKPSVCFEKLAVSIIHLRRMSAKLCQHFNKLNTG